MHRLFVTTCPSGLGNIGDIDFSPSKAMVWGHSYDQSSAKSPVHIQQAGKSKTFTASLGMESKLLLFHSTTLGSVAKWFVRWTTKLATWVRSQIAAGLLTGYSVLGGNLTGYWYQQYWARLDNRGGNDTHRGLCWKQVFPSIPGGDFRRLPTLNKRPLPLQGQC